jgi:hypothetical protein
MFEKRPETLETQHRHAAMTYLVGNFGSVGLLDGARPYAHAMPAVAQGRGHASRSREGAAGRGRGGPDPMGHGKGCSRRGVGEGTPWRPPDLGEDACGGGVAGSIEGRGGGLLEPPWSAGSGRHGVRGEGRGRNGGE